MKSYANYLCALTVGACCVQVNAYEAGDWILRVGYAVVDPRDNSGDLSVQGVGKLDGTGVGVDGATALGITASYMITPHWGIELLAASPFEHDVTSKGLGGLGVADGTRLGSVKHLPPTVSVQYYFLAPESRLQPYAGLGLNYTMFFDESESSQAKSALGATNLNLDDSFGFAAEAGLDWRVDEHWLVNASVWRVQIETDATVDTALGRAKTSVAINPWVYMLAVGYRF